MERVHGLKQKLTMKYVTKMQKHAILWNEIYENTIQRLTFLAINNGKKFIENTSSIFMPHQPYLTTV